MHSFQMARLRSQLKPGADDPPLSPAEALLATLYLRTAEPRPPRDPEAARPSKAQGGGLSRRRRHAGT